MTDIEAKTSRPCGTCAMPRRMISSGRKPAHSSPPSRIEPARGFTMPLSVLRIVVLPEPLPPSNATMRPSGTEKATSRRTSVAPYHTLSPVTSSMQFLAKIGGDDFGILAHRVGRPLGDARPAGQYGDLVAHPHDQPDD